MPILASIKNNPKMSNNSQLPPTQRLFYSKLKFLASIPSTPELDTGKLSDQQVYQTCQYIEPYMLEKDKSGLLARLQQYRDSENGDSCLHIAAKASNKRLVAYLLQQDGKNANIVNYKGDNALVSMLRQNTEAKAEQIGYILAKFTDLNQRNQEGKRAFEVHQAKMDPMRARLLEHLRNKAMST